MHCDGCQCARQMPNSPYSSPATASPPPLCAAYTMLLKQMEGPTTFAAPLMILKAKWFWGQLFWFPHSYRGSCLPAREEQSCKAMALALRGDIGSVPKGLSGADTGAQWAMKGVTAGPSSCMKEACPGAGTCLSFEVYGAEA